MKYNIVAPAPKPVPEITYPYFARGGYSKALILFLSKDRCVYLENGDGTLGGIVGEVNEYVANIVHDRIVGTITFTQE